MCDGQRNINFLWIMSVAPKITHHIRIVASTPYGLHTQTDNVAKELKKKVPFLTYEKTKDHRPLSQYQKIAADRAEFFVSPGLEGSSTVTSQSRRQPISYVIYGRYIYCKSNVGYSHLRQRTENVGKLWAYSIFMHLGIPAWMCLFIICNIHQILLT